MANKSKNKGDTEERAVVNLLRDNDFSCQRTLEAGARSDGSKTWDIDLHLNRHIILHGECKIRKAGLKFIYDSIGENDFLTYRTNNNPRLYVLNEETFLKLLKRAR